MELILINKNKLKIMLDESDMKKYHIGSESDCAEGSTRQAIRSLLESARDQIGFETDGEEIFVQLYASKHGGCELFVTKCDTSRAIRSQRPTGLLDSPGRKNISLAYSFEDLAGLIKACKILASRAYNGHSSAFCDDVGNFYLILKSDGANAFARLDQMTFLVEFGRRESPDPLLTYIAERGKVICDSNAVETLSGF